MQYSEFQSAFEIALAEHPDIGFILSPPNIIKEIELSGIHSTFWQAFGYILDVLAKNKDQLLGQAKSLTPIHLEKISIKVKQQNNDVKAEGQDIDIKIEKQTKDFFVLTCELDEIINICGCFFPKAKQIQIFMDTTTGKLMYEKAARKNCLSKESIILGEIPAAFFNPNLAPNASALRNSASTITDLHAHPSTGSHSHSDSENDGARTPDIKEDIKGDSPRLGAKI